MAVKLKIDTPLSVVQEPEISWLIDLMNGGYAEHGDYSDTIYDPVTRTLFLRPRQFEDDFTPEPMSWEFPAHGDWELVSVGPTGNDYAVSKNGTADTLLTHDRVPANGALIFSFFVYGSIGRDGAYEVCCLTFGQYWLRVYADGRSILTTSADSDKVLGRGYLGGAQNDITGRYVRLLVLPFNRHDILFWSDTGGSWVYHDLSLSLAETDNEITAEGEAGCAFLHSKAVCQVQRVVYPGSGIYTTATHDLGYAPKDNGDEIAINVRCDKNDGDATLELLDEDGNTFATPDGETRKIKATFTLTGNGSKTPFVYAGNIVFPGHAQERSGSSAESSHRGLMFADDSDVRFTVDPTSEGYDKSAMVAGQAFTLTDDSDPEQELFSGVMSSPSLIGSQAPSHDVQGKSAVWKLLEAVQFRSDLRLDGRSDVDLLTKCFTICGVTDDRLNLTATPVALPADPRGKATLYPIKAGTSVAEVVRWLLDYWTNETLTVRLVDSVQKVCYGPEESGEPVKTFRKSDLAGQRDAYGSNLKTWKGRKGDKAGADDHPFTRVVVRGQAIDGDDLYAEQPDPATDNPAENPELAMADRPDGWVGGQIAKLLTDPRLCSQDAVDHMALVLKARYLATATYARWVAAYDPNPEVSIGAVVTLEGHGEFRILAMRPWNGRDLEINAGEAVIWDTLTAGLVAHNIGQHDDYQPIVYIGEKLDATEEA